VLALYAAACSYYKADCLDFGFDRAEFTLRGVYCYVDRMELAHPYMSLKDLQERAVLQERLLQPTIKPPFDIVEW